MKKVKKKSIIIPIIILVLIIIFDLVFIYFMKNRQVDSKKDLEIISTNYKKLESEVEKFSKLRDEFYKQSENDFFIESMSPKVNYWNEFINKYQSEIKTIDDISKKIKGKCENIYADSSTNEKCSKYHSNYEMSINYYITDINFYNKFALEFNKTSNDKLNIVKLEYEYIDFDKDGIFTGKLEGETNE